MAIISQTTKIDKSFKFVSGKGYTSSQKGVDNEDAASGFIVGTGSIFAQDAGIPTTAPGATTAIMTFYGTTTRFKMVNDISSPTNLAWYASTDGTSLTTMRATRVPNWIPPAFGNYTVRIFLTNGASTSASPVQELFFSDQTAPQFDYKTGILTFEVDPLATYAGLSPTPNGIQIVGYVYVGQMLNQVFDGNGNFANSLSDIGTSTSVAGFLNPNKSFEVSSIFAIGTAWQIEVTPFGTSSVEWRGIYELPNGQIIAVGGDTSDTVPYIAFSYGIGGPPGPGFNVWRAANLTNSSGVHKLLAVWAASNSVIYASSTGTGSTNLIKSTNGGLDWDKPSIAPSLGGAITAIGGTSTTDVYIIGTFGQVYYSTDGTVFNSASGTGSNDLFGIWNRTTTDVYVVGNSGTILHSSTPGVFTSQTSGTSNSLKSVFGLSATDIYAVGSSGTVLHSAGVGTWTAFGTGIPSTFNCTGVWGKTSGTTSKIYISGTDTISGFSKVYFSTGNGSWTAQFTGTSTSTYSMSGGVNGIYFGGNNGKVNTLHQNPTSIVHGNSVIDGYLSAGLAVYATEAQFSKRLTITDSFIGLDVSISKQGVNTTNTNVYPTGIKITSTDAADLTQYIVLSANSADAGEGFRFWRESVNVYSLDVGSKVSTGGDGTTPLAAGGRIRLGGFTNSPSTTARGEIETVSSAGLKMAAYQGDLTIANLFGVSGSTKGDVNLTTQNGAIRLTATGSESPSPSGQIILTPGTGAYVLLATNTSASTFRTQSPGGNYNLMDGTGSFSNSGSVDAGTTVSVVTTKGSTGTPTAAITRGVVYKDILPIAWGTVSMASSTATLVCGFNISSVIRVSAGLCGVLFVTAPSTTNYTVITSMDSGTSPNQAYVMKTSRISNTEFVVATYDLSLIAKDQGFYFVVYAL